MGLLFVTPNWQAPSELWLQRMLDALEPDIVAVATLNPPEPRWHGRVPLLRLADVPASTWRSAARRAGLRVSLWPRSGAQRTLARAVARPDVDVVLVHYLDFALRFEEVWRTCGKPVFAYAHGYDTEWEMRHPDDAERPFHPAGYADAIARLSECVTYVVNSPCVRARLLAIDVPAERVLERTYGIPTRPQPPVRPMNTTHVECLYLGRLVDCKGPDLVIRAFELACAKGFDGRLTLAGDGPLRTACELARLRSTVADRIRLTGAVDAVTGAALRATADIFTAHNCRGPLSQQEESFGVSVVEAMCDALPVITGRSGGVADTVRDGETGFLVMPGDINAHAAGLVRLGRDPMLRRTMGVAGYRRARAEYDCERRWVEFRAVLGLDGAQPAITAVPAVASAGVENAEQAAPPAGVGAGPRGR